MLDRFTPTFAFCVLEREKVEKMGSIIIPDEAQSKYSPTKGKLIKAGPNCEPEIADAVGKTVWFAKFAGDWIKDKDSGAEIFICNEQDIIGVEA